MKVKRLSPIEFEVITDNVEDLVAWLLPEDSFQKRCTITINGSTYQFISHNERIAFAAGLHKANGIIAEASMRIR